LIASVKNIGGFIHKNGCGMWVLTYIANNFISLREQSIKIDPNSTDTSLTENLAATVISFQILMRSIESKTSISANGFELTDVGLSRAGYMGLSTSLRYSGQCMNNCLFAPFRLDYEKSTSSEVKLWAQSVCEELVKDKAKHVKTQSIAEQIAGLQAAVQGLEKRVKTLESDNQQLKTQVRDLQGKDPSSNRVINAALINNAFMGPKSFTKNTGFRDNQSGPLFPLGVSGFSDTT